MLGTTVRLQGQQKFPQKLGTQEKKKNSAFLLTDFSPFHFFFILDILRPGYSLHPWWGSFFRQCGMMFKTQHIISGKTSTLANSVEIFTLKRHVINQGMSILLKYMSVKHNPCPES